MKKSAYILSVILLTLFVCPVSAQDAYTILSEEDITMKANISGISMGSREVKHIVYEYPSTDPDGNAVTISGVIMAPIDIVNGTVPCDGIIMYNHYTIGSTNDAPSVGGEGITAASTILASPLKPNYIIVASDYIGYGSSIDHIVSYICGDTNGRNSLDGLLAAFRLLEDKQIPQGKYLFNLGYSQGGTETMYAARLTDTEEKYKNIRFTKSFSGGGALDFEKIFRIYIDNDHCEDLEDVVMMVASVNENYHLGIPYNAIFKEPLASKVLEYFHSKDKSVVAELTELNAVSDIMQPEFMNEKNEYAKLFMAKLRDISITNGWEPDLTKQYFLAHSRHDNYVPIQSGRGMITWMKEKGFTPSIVPGKTSLQTNTAIFKLNHQQAAVVWAIQTLAAMQFWPVLYYEGEQNRYYHDVVKDMNLMKFIKILESLGIDVRSLLSSSMARGNLPTRFTLFDLIPDLAERLATVNLTTDDLDEMCEDAGITQADLIMLFAYLQEEPASAPATTLEDRLEAPLFLLRYYEQQLANWFMLAGYDVNYSLWGM
ncbi:MAG: hypothetical protein J5797_01055 [Prevotella sp.]|nr:hypothetical protein [Prevotella sp.]